MRSWGSYSKASIPAGGLIVAVILVLTSAAGGQPNTSTAQSPGPVFYVSPVGSDADPGTIDRPFETLERARQAVRQVIATMHADVVVYLRGGRYQLQSTFSLDQADSGRSGFNVIYQSYPGEMAIVSGGRIVTGWVRDGLRWKAFVGRAERTRQLYVNGQRAIRAKTAVGLDKAVTTPTGYIIPGLRMEAWQNPTDVEVVSLQKFRLYRCGVARVSRSSLDVKQPCWDLSRIDRPVAMGTPTWIENALEFLDAPGQWYLNRATGWLYYRPRHGENISSVRVIAPVLEKLLEVVGTPAAPVHNLIFRRITFADGTWLGPDGPMGFSDIQANVFAEPGPNRRSMHLVPASVSVDFAQSVTFDHDVFTRLGAAGLALNHVNKAVVFGCDFHDISGNGINVGDFDRPKDPDPPFATFDVGLYDNVIHDVAVEYQGGVGIWLGYVHDSVVRNNDISRLPYTGISIGWGWGNQDPTVAGKNLVKANHVHDYMLELYDGGGIYSLSAQPGNLYTENVVERGPHSYGGIYLDDGSRYVEVSRNVLIGNQKTVIVKGKDNQVHDNWWQAGSSRDLIVNRKKFCFVRACELNHLRNNHLIKSPDQVPANIFTRAGIDP
jgi:hypothetical protein